MKLLFSSSIQDVDIVKGMLAEEGIACEVLNDTGAYRGGTFDPELWVADDAQFDRASAVLGAFRKSPAPQLGPWTCPRCGEKLEAQFQSCWKCGVARNEAV